MYVFYRFEYDDIDFEDLLQKMEYIIHNTNYKNLENYFPFLGQIIPYSKVKAIGGEHHH